MKEQEEEWEHDWAETLLFSGACGAAGVFCGAARCGGISLLCVLLVSPLLPPAPNQATKNDL